MRRYLVAGLVVVALGAQALVAQQQGGSSAQPVPLQNGVLTGRISSLTEDAIAVPTASLQVRLFHRGTLLKTTLTNAAGEFRFHGLGPGHYSLVGTGRNGFVAFGVNVVADEPTPAEGNGYAIDTLAVPPPLTAVYRIMATEVIAPRRSAQPTYDQLLLRGLLRPNESRPQLAAWTKAEMLGSVVAGRTPIPLTAEGALRGVVKTLDARIDLEKLTAHLIQGDREVARAAVDGQGNFELRDVQPGVYGLVVAGVDGLAAVQIHVVSAEQTTAAAGRGVVRQASLQPQIGFEISPMSPADLQAFLQSLPPELANQLAGLLGLAPPFPPAPAAPAPAVGGGGGLGGLDPLGLLGAGLGAAGLAAGLSAEEGPVLASPF